MLSKKQQHQSSHRIRGPFKNSPMMLCDAASPDWFWENQFPTLMECS